MDSLHTPGPWFCDSAYVEGCDRAAVRAQDGALLAVAWPGERDDGGILSNEEQDANAALMSAAPELLAALRAGYFAFEHNGDEAPEDRAILDRMLAAINKAEGRA